MPYTQIVYIFKLTAFVTAYEPADLLATKTKGKVTQAVYEVQDGTVP